MDSQPERLPPTYREIEPEIYKEHFRLGVRIKDLPIIVLGGILFLLAPLYLRLGAITGVLMLLLWLGASTSFFRWARNNRRPLWLEHKLESWLRGKTQQRVNPSSEKYTRSYLLDE